MKNLSLYNNYSPLVSIILPTFNRGYKIKDAINSVLDQTIADWELIIVDDGSTDNTFEIINNILMKDERIKYVKHTNRKPPLSINTGINISVGKYLTFLGSDDELKENHLELRLNFFEENNNVNVIHGGVEIIGDPFVKDKNDLTKEIHINECVVGATIFAKREIFIQLGGFNKLPYSDDSDFIERAEKKYKVEKVHFPTYIYNRNSDDSICNSI